MAEQILCETVGFCVNQLVFLIQETYRSLGRKNKSKTGTNYILTNVTQNLKLINTISN